MKLWHCTCEANGQTPYGFYPGETEEEALAQYEEDLKWQMTDYYAVSADVIENVYGYEVRLVKK